MRWPSERRECGGVSRLLQDTSQFSSSKKDAAGTEVREDEGTVAIVRTSRPVERPSNGHRVSFESKTRARVLFSAPPDQCFLLLLLLLFFFLFFFPSNDPSFQRKYLYDGREWERAETKISSISSPSRSEA